MKKILVGYDDTDSSKRALERAAELAKAFDAKVVVTSVAPLLPGAARSVGPVDPTDSPAMHEEQLRHAADALSAQGITPELAPATGDPAAAIVRLADDVDADLVIVGTREPSVVERVVHASVSRRVANHVHRDLLIVHPDHRPRAS
jgi:nucleotide-binding universal stress UspA family protein